MRYTQAVTILLISLVAGCGGTLAPYTPLIASTIDTVADLVKQRTGRDIQDLPHTCEYEFSDSGKQLDILCTFQIQSDGSTSSSD